jgi:putative membrane protein
MMYGSYGMGLWGTLFMLVGALLLWGLIVVSVVLLVHYLKGSDRPSRPADAGQPARDVLSLRYARGEIDDNEYAQRLDVLTSIEPRRGRG